MVTPIHKHSLQEYSMKTPAAAMEQIHCNCESDVFSLTQSLNFDSVQNPLIHLYPREHILPVDFVKPALQQHRLACMLDLV